MTASRCTDTFVVFYGGARHIWTAYNIQTCRIGMGTTPKKAMANGIKTADQFILSETKHEIPQRVSSFHDLMLLLAKTAGPLPDGEGEHGIVYKYERT